MRALLTVALGLLWTHGIAQTQQEIDWIKNNSVEISANPENYTDFTFLDSLLATKRIVMLGENTHGTSEYFILKNRMIRYLHENLDFNVLSWESSLLDCFAVESQKSELTSKEMAQNSLHFVYRTDQVLPIMNYAKNSDLIFTGFDPQPTVYSDATAQFIGQLDCLGDSLKDQLSYIDSLSQTYSKASRKNRNRKKYAAVYEGLLEQISETKCSRTIKEFLSIGIEDRIFFLNNWNKGRDERMANNIMWLLNEKYPNDKFIIYAHNVHNDPSNQKNSYANFKTMAEFLPDSILNITYNIGLFGHSGTARNNVGESYYQFKQHPELSLENYLSKTGYDITFLNITNNERTENISFLFEPINTMYWGNIKNPKVLSEHYDAVILIKDVTPSTKLKK